MKRRVIYQVLTDRFAGSGGAVLKGLSRTGPASRWRQFAGGNFQGLRRRLSYLESLGMSALWLSPVYENSFLPAEPRKPRQDGYHGYWSRDFERLSPAFGTEVELRGLLEECSRRNIRTILDVVLNHSNPTYSSDRGALYREGTLFAEHSPDDGGHFHHLGFLDQSQAYDPYLWENGDVWDLADLAQENSEVADYLREAHIKWLSLGFSGVRLDTALHVPATYIRQWASDMREAVPACDFFFGEWWNGGPHNPVSTRLSREAEMPLTDFGLAQAWRRMLCGRSPLDSLGEWVELQDDYLQPDLKVNFLDNHDMPRLKNRLLDQGYDVEQAGARLELGLVCLLLWRGVPCVYYGTENGLFTRRRARGKAWGQDPYNRDLMTFPQEPTVGMELCALMSGWRRKTDLVEHPLTWREEGGNRRLLQRGAASLEFGTDSEGLLRHAALRWKGEEVWANSY